MDWIRNVILKNIKKIYHECFIRKINGYDAINAIMENNYSISNMVGNVYNSMVPAKRIQVCELCYSDLDQVYKFMKRINLQGVDSL